MTELDALNLNTSAPQGLNIAGVTSKEAAREAAREFEAMFIAQMLKPVFESLDTDGPFGGGSAERAFQPMLVDEYAKEMSKGDGIGLADTIYREILKLQGLETSEDA